MGDFPNLNAAVSPDLNMFKEDPTWKKPLNKLAGCESLVVIGASNSGKSTFCSYILNKMANEGITEAYYLEADCGQPNFSILPG